jgi:hypothetical protein
MLTTTNPIHARFGNLWKFMAIGLVIVYIINCLTPLRLHVDTLRYFAIKDCIESGCPPGSTAAQDYLPYGYTALLLALSKLGLLKSCVIVLINCAYLFGGLHLIKKMFRSTIYPFFFVVLVLLNWTIIKFVTHPLSEMQYLFFSMGCLYFFYRYTQNKNLLSLLLAFVFGAIAFLTRTVGLALAAALVTSLIWQYRKELILLVRKHKILGSVILIVLIGIAVFSKQLGLNHYTGVMTKQFNEGSTFGGILKWHFTEWAEIGFNMSSVKILPHLPSSVGKVFFILAGMLFFAGFVYLLFFRKNNIPFIIKTYLVFYCIMMFNWPFNDPRFWVPVLPLVAVVIAQTSFYNGTKNKWLLSFLFSVYMLIGTVSAGYMTYTSLNREVMARTQANGVYRNEYETLFFGKPQSDTAKKTDPVILHVLERYDR